jgi:hypothetical protein
MLDQVVLLFEDQGRPKARHRLAFPQAEHEGLFTFKEAHCSEFRRTVPVARLQGPTGSDVVPPLYDAKLLWMEGGEARVTGLEVDEVTRKRTAQCWNVRLAGCAK